MAFQLEQLITRQFSSFVKKTSNDFKAYDVLKAKTVKLYLLQYSRMCFILYEFSYPKMLRLPCDFILNTQRHLIFQRWKTTNNNIDYKVIASILSNWRGTTASAPRGFRQCILVRHQLVSSGRTAGHNGRRRWYGGRGMSSPPACQTNMWINASPNTHNRPIFVLLREAMNWVNENSTIKLIN